MIEKLLYKRWERRGLRLRDINAKMAAYRKLEGVVFVIIVLALLLLSLYFFFVYEPPEAGSGEGSSERTGYSMEVPVGGVNLDVDGDGTVTKEELNSVWQLLDVKKTLPAPPEFWQALDRAIEFSKARYPLAKRDLNGDGQVSLSEEYRFLHRFDANGSGKLEEPEQLLLEEELRLKFEPGWDSR